MPTNNNYYDANMWVYLLSSDSKFDRTLYTSLIRSFINFFKGNFVLRISARQGHIFWYVIDLSLKGTQPPVIGNNMEIARLTAGDELEVQWQHPVHHIIYLLHPLQTYSIPFLYINEISSHNDPLETVVNAMSGLNDQEELHYFLHVRRAHKPPIFGGTWLRDMVGRGVHGTPTPDGQPITNKAQQMMQDKGIQTLYECRLYIQANANSPERADALAQNVAGAFRGFARTRTGEPQSDFAYVKLADFELISSWQTVSSNPIFVYLRKLSELQEKHGSNAYEKVFKNEWAYLTIDELAALWHLPHNGFSNADVTWLKTVPEVPSEVAKNQNGIILGDGVHKNESVPVRLPIHNRTTHMNVIGQTGSGKSTFLHNLIHQDIAEGRGVCVIDPHGTLVQDVLRYSIPQNHRERDVVLLDFGQSDYPVPFNIFALTKNPTTLGYIADIIEIITARHHGNTTGVQTSVYLKNALQVLSYTDAPTMRSIQKFLMDGSYRLECLENLPFEADYLYDWWMDHYHDSPKEQLKISTPILTRIDTFIENRHTYPSLCHPESINIQEFVKEKRIVLVSLKASRKQMSEKDRDIIGALFIMMLQMFGMESVEQVSIPKFYIYVDEVQYFTTTALDKLFAEARKFGLSMTVANQYLSQLDTSTMDAVMNNVGATVAFGIGTKDATTLTPFMSPNFDRDSLVQMNSHEAAVRMKLGTATQPAFWLKTRPPIKTLEEYTAEEIENRALYLRGISAQYHTPKSRSVVETWLRKQYPRRRGRDTSLDEHEHNTTDNDSDDDLKDQFLTSS